MQRDAQRLDRELENIGKHEPCRAEQRGFVAGVARLDCNSGVGPLRGHVINMRGDAADQRLTAKDDVAV